MGHLLTATRDPWLSSPSFHRYRIRKNVLFRAEQEEVEDKEKQAGDP